MDKEPLLEPGDQESHTKDTIQRPMSERSQPAWLAWSLAAIGLAYAPLLILYVFLYISGNDCNCKASDAEAYSAFPALAKSTSLKFENRQFPVKIKGNPYAGYPRPELDAAWHELFEDTRMRVSKEDLEYYNVTSIPLADGSGYAAELGVHHELHCLKKIRHWIYKDYYLAKETRAELVHYEKHVNHCLELMREGIMCRGDPSLSTYEWIPGDSPGFTAVAHGPHRCVNWNSLLSWVRERAVPVYEPGTLAGTEEMHAHGS